MQVLSEMMRQENLRLKRSIKKLQNTLVISTIINKQWDKYTVYLPLPPFFPYFSSLWQHYQHHPFIPEQLPFAEVARNGANYSAFRAPFSHWLVAFYLRGLACPFQRPFATPFSVWYQTKATRPDTHVIPQAILRRKEMNILVVFSVSNSVQFFIVAIYLEYSIEKKILSSKVK